MLATLPLFPTDATGAESVLEVLTKTAEQFAVVSTVEWNFVSGPRANGVVQTIFDRLDEDATARAHAFRDLVKHRLAELGGPAYRSDIDHASDELSKRDDGVGSLAARIKGIVDPRGLMAPGRYVPSETVEGS